MVRRLVSVGDDLTLPPSVKVASVSQVTDAGTAGKAVLRAATATEARTAVGLTSVLVVVDVPVGQPFPTRPDFPIVMWVSENDPVAAGAGVTGDLWSQK